MYKSLLSIFGLGMIALWLAGLASSPETGYMTWLDGIAGVISFIEAGAMQTATRREMSTAIVLLSIGLFGLWIGGLLGGAVSWQVWWTFAAACAYLVLGISAGAGKQSAVVEDQQRPRRVA
jgi:hypothetical protein